MLWILLLLVILVVLWIVGLAVRGAGSPNASAGPLALGDCSTQAGPAGSPDV